jgi:hypothetical protein
MYCTLNTGEMIIIIKDQFTHCSQYEKLNSLLRITENGGAPIR